MTEKQSIINFSCYNSESYVIFNDSEVAFLMGIFISPEKPGLFLCFVKE